MRGLVEVVREIEADPVLDGDWKLTCGLDKSDEGLSYLLRAAGVKVYLELYLKDMIGSQEGLILAGWSVEEVRIASLGYELTGITEPPAYQTVPRSFSRNRGGQRSGLACLGSPTFPPMRAPRSRSSHPGSRSGTMRTAGAAAIG